MISHTKVSAPLVPKIRREGDTSQFQEYAENENMFKIAHQAVHVKDFEDFWSEHERTLTLHDNLGMR